MKIVIAKNPIKVFNSRPSSSLLRFRVPSLSWKNCNFAFNSSKKWIRYTKSLRFSSMRASCAPSSTFYGGWDDLEIVGDSDRPGESDAFHDFIVSFGINDRKNIFVFVLGLVCAMAISRVKVSSIIVVPASVLVFAIGFTVGFIRQGTFSSVRVNGSNRKEKEENLKLSADKLRRLVEFFDDLDLLVNNLKSDVQRSIMNNKIVMDDLNGYVKVTDSIKLSALNARNIARSLIDNEENSSGVSIENQKIGRRKKEAGEPGNQMLQSIGNFFGENLVSPNSNKVRENFKKETVEKPSGHTRGSGTVPPVEDRALKFGIDRSVNGKFYSSQDSLGNSDLGAEQNGKIKTTSEKETLGSGDMRGSTKRFPDGKEYNYRNNRLWFANNHSFSLKMDSSIITDMSETHDNLLDSESFKVRMKHVESESSIVREQLLNQGHETSGSSHDKRDSGFESSQYKEDGVNNHDHCHFSDDLPAHGSEFNSPSSVKISDDRVFDRYLAEATDLLKQAKEFIKGRHDEEQTEIMLYRSANLLSNAVDLKPRSLLAVGQLGNTYLLHGELKLKISRELRTILSGSIQSLSGKLSKIQKELKNKITSKEQVASLLIDVCEECEELLVEAGRKYRLALSIDGNDARALYNWGLALSFRGQLIADIGPGSAFEAERVFLAAIDKFDAMLLKGNVYAPDALFRWGVALQQRSRLRPSSSKEKVKLLQQAKRLYEDALHMDSNNMQVKAALSSCISELNYRQF